MLRRRATSPGTLVAVAAALAVAVTPTLPAGTASAADQVRDGSSSSTALASCWDVKQVRPSAPDGLYWLYTPALQYPQQFWCDQTTAGGGWVLVGRGRENWALVDEGQGAASEVANPMTGTAAFAPKMLSATTVNALLAGTAVKDLADGIRIRRATSSSGSSWQEVRVRPSTMTDWHWALNGGYPLTSASFDGVTVSGGTTGSAGTGTSTSSLRTYRYKQNGSQAGFGFDRGVTGSTSSTSYLWSKSSGYALPFAQVFLRPKVRWADQTFPSATNGLPGSTVRSLASNLAEPQPAGVSGLANGRSTERDTEVRAFAQIGTRMFVGGNFAQVDQYAAASSTSQRYLAAFDVATGAFDPTFLPALDGKVNALAALPNGMLAVGGEFTQVNGVAQAGLVVLDPATGQQAAGFSVTLNPGTTTLGVVTALDVSGSWLYVGGNFTHVAGGGAGRAYAKRAARVNAATGRPDYTWNPAFDGSPIFLEVSASGDRVYVGGFMSTMNDGKNPAKRFAVVTAASPAAPVPGLKTWVPNNTSSFYQQTGTEVGNRFWLGGAEHSFFVYDTADFSLLRGAITRNDYGKGGDFQASVADGSVVYGSCHCSLSNTYGDGRGWPMPPTFDAIGSTRFIAAFDAQTGVQLNAFLPQMRTRAIRGPWALTMDNRGCLWQGGDTTQTKTATGWQQSGGFSRFCRNDSVAPTVPPAAKAVKNADGTVTVSWTGSTDNASGAIRYTVFRDNLAVWSGTAWKATLPAVSGASTYAVRAFDRAGNLSATTVPITIA